MLNVRYLSLILLAFVFLASPAEARTHRHHRGSCDGFHACRCGATAARAAGLPYVFHGVNLKQARGWLAFQHTSIHTGAVGYVPRRGYTGHVFTVVAYGGGLTATVRDDRGTYERSIRGAMFVQPGVI